MNAKRVESNIYAKTLNMVLYTVAYDVQSAPELLAQLVKMDTTVTVQYEKGPRNLEDLERVFIWIWSSVCGYAHSLLCIFQPHQTLQEVARVSILANGGYTNMILLKRNLDQGF